MINGIFLINLTLHKGEKDKIYYNATDWNVNTTKNDKLKTGLQGNFT